MKPGGLDNWTNTCHVCDTPFEVRRQKHPRAFGDEFGIEPVVCPVCDAPLRLRNMPLNASALTNFIFGLFGEPDASSHVGGSQSMLRRQIRSEQDFDGLVELMTSVSLDATIARIEASLNLRTVVGQHTKRIFTRLVAERDAGLLEVRLRSMVNQAKAELAMERERHLAILAFRRERGLV